MKNLFIILMLLGIVGCVTQYDKPSSPPGQGGGKPPKDSFTDTTPQFSNTWSTAGWQTTNIWKTLSRTNLQEDYRFIITTNKY